MLTAQSPLSTRGISCRRPLQPITSPATSLLVDNNKLKLNLKMTVTNNSNKENHGVVNYSTPVKIEFLDQSLAEELNAIREKLDRLRLDKERTEDLLKERDQMLVLQMQELKKRSQVQKTVELEVDRLYRLNQLRSSCMRKTSIRSLRDKEQDKKMKGLEEGFQFRNHRESS